VTKQTKGRRAEIAMSPEEVTAFLEEERLLTCASLGRDGWPHLVPLTYAVRGGECWSWTYAKSQKVRNLERDPRCTVQVEAGERYSEYRGVMIKAQCELHRDLDTVVALGEELALRVGGAVDPERVRQRASKRVALRFRACEIVSWDHRKL